LGRKKKKEAKSTERQAYGLTVLKASNRKIRQLKRKHEPEIHGNKLWTSSWLIMDFLEQQGLPKKPRVMEVGCGWGLAGIYCAKRHRASVLGIDADENVFPYLDLHAEVNGVKLKRRRGRFEGIRKKDLAGTDLLLGSDICFWDDMVDPVYKLIRRAVRAGVQQVIVADPGRPPFQEVAERCADKLGGITQDWAIDDQVKASGTLLIVGSLPH